MALFYGQQSFCGRNVGATQRFVVLQSMMPSPVPILPRATRLFLQLGFLSLMLSGLAVSGMAQNASATATTTTTATPATTATPTKAESLTVASKRYDAEKELARMTKHYSLTADQKAKIQPLLLEQQRQVHTLGEDTSLTNSEWTAAVRKVHQKTVAQVKLHLTEAQVSKYAKDEAKLAKNSQGDSDDADDDGPPPDGPPPGGGPGGPGGGGPPGM
jgi:hypothetical protein